MLLTMRCAVQAAKRQRSAVRSLLIPLLVLLLAIVVYYVHQVREKLCCVTSALCCMIVFRLKVVAHDFVCIRHVHKDVG